ncbi:MAG: hypothetical protein U0166_04645 [Acidobacteriota bacterium]
MSAGRSALFQLYDLWDAAKRRRGIGFSVAGLLAFDLVFGMLVLWPLGRHLASLRASAAAEQDAYRVAHAQYEDRRALALNVYDAMKACQGFRKDVARTKEERYLPFKQALEKVVGLSPSGAPQMTFITGDDRSGFLETTATCAVEGTYTRLRQILSELKVSSEFLMIDRVSLSKGHGPPGTVPMTRLSLQISTVFSAHQEPSHLDDPRVKLARIERTPEAPKKTQGAGAPAAPAKTAPAKTEPGNATPSKPAGAKPAAPTKPAAPATGTPGASKPAVPPTAPPPPSRPLGAGHQ